MPNRKREIRGCIDLGSSYFRLLVVERKVKGGLSHGGIGDLPGDEERSHGSRSDSDDMRILADDRAYVGWGTALSRNGLLLPCEIEKAERALSLLVSKASEAGCGEPAIVATNTLRRSLNREEALGRLNSVTPLRVAILSQRGEAALGFLGASTVAEGEGWKLQIDMGGTSTEIAWGRDGVMSDYIGLPWGTHTARVVMSGCGPHRALATLRGLIFPRPSCSLASILYHLPGTHGADTILCTGGTAVSLAIILNYMRRIGPLFRERESISKGDLERMLRRLWVLFETGRQHRLPLEKERVNLLLPGMILLTLLFREMCVPAFSVTSRDIRWGGIIAGNNLTEYSIDGRRDR